MCIVHIPRMRGLTLARHRASLGGHVRRGFVVVVPGSVRSEAQEEARDFAAEDRDGALRPLAIENVATGYVRCLEKEWK